MIKNNFYQVDFINFRQAVLDAYVSGGPGALDLVLNPVLFGSRGPHPGQVALDLFLRGVQVSEAALLRRSTRYRGPTQRRPRPTPPSRPA